MTVRTVTMMMCDACLYGTGPCNESACIGSAKRMPDPIHNPALMLINGFAMCVQCEVKRAEHVTDRGTDDERHYCGDCFGPVAQRNSDSLEDLRRQLRLARLTPVGNA